MTDDRRRSDDARIDEILRHVESHNLEFQYLRKMLEKHEEVIFGNGGVGLKTQVDRLEQTEQSRTWHLRALWVTILGMLAKMGFGVFQK